MRWKTVKFHTLTQKSKRGGHAKSQRRPNFINICGENATLDLRISLARPADDMPRNHWSLRPLSIVLLLTACSAEPVGSSAGPRRVSPDLTGKSDNYISTFASEFRVFGTALAALPEGYADLTSDAQDEAVADAVEKGLSQASRALRKHIDAVIKESNGTMTGEDAKYFTYYRPGNEQSDNVRAMTQEGVEFDFELEIIGSTSLIDMVTGGSGRFEIDLEGSTSGYGTAALRDTTLMASIAPTASRDAFPKYDALFEDGIYEISVHFGGDYNEERYDLETAKWLVETLVEDGWENPDVQSYDDLKIDSQPFRKMLRVGGRDVEARVYIFHADLADAENEEQLAESMRTSFQGSDVVIYSGHAGSNAGFILDYEPRFEIKANEFKNLPMSDRYQIFVLDGCTTYRTYVEDLMENPAKTFDNVDIVTTVNNTPFWVGYQVLHEFIYWLTLTTNDGTHLPISWKQILGGINTEELENVHYGVHGIDNDPQLNPNGGQEALCRACETDADCEGGGNFCLDTGNGGFCGVACTSSEACGTGYACAPITEDPKESWYMPKQCIPQGANGC